MNGNDTLARAGQMDPKLFAKPAPFDLAELQVLRAFYKAWEALHAVPKDKLHKKQQEEAARKLVEQAHILRRMNVG